MPQENKRPHIVVILAGGGARRMGGADKGELVLGGRRLIDHVLAQLEPQTGSVLISGRHDYRTGHAVLSDREDGPRGPAAGLWAALKWIEEHAPGTEGFLSVPVDGPFAPEDLVERLTSHEKSAVACDESVMHPTFAYWQCDALHGALSMAPQDYGVPLKELADSVHAARVVFEDANAFLNINTPEDIRRAEDILRG